MSRAPNHQLGLRVLVADDDEANRAVSRLMLEAFGCLPEPVADGHAAVEAAAREDFDLILLDINMPGLEGPDCARRIREREAGHPDTRRTPIIALSADLPEAGRERCRRVGIDDFLEKPYRPAELLAVLKKWAHAPTTGSAPAHRAPAARSSDVLDPRIVSELRALGHDDDPDPFGRLAAIYLKQSADLMAALRHAAAHGNTQGLERAAHMLKSSSGHLGACRLSELCRRLEAAVQRGDAIRPLVAPIEAEYPRVVEALERESPSGLRPAQTAPGRPDAQDKAST